jgi:hypothetical protein
MLAAWRNLPSVSQRRLRRAPAAGSPLDLIYLLKLAGAWADLLLTGRAITDADPISKAMQISKTVYVPAMK